MVPFGLTHGTFRALRGSRGSSQRVLGPAQDQPSVSIVELAVRRVFDALGLQASCTSSHPIGRCPKYISAYWMIVKGLEVRGKATEGSVTCPLELAVQGGIFLLPSNSLGQRYTRRRPGYVAGVMLTVHFSFWLGSARNSDLW